jgi:hypothetical protein
MMMRWPALAKPSSEGDAAGAIDHVVEVLRILRHDAVHAPHDRELATGGEVRRDRDHRRLRPFTRARTAVVPELVQQMIADRSSVSAICRRRPRWRPPPVASGSGRWAYEYDAGIGRIALDFLADAPSSRRLRPDICRRRIRPTA